MPAGCSGTKTRARVSAGGAAALRRPRRRRRRRRRRPPAPASRRRRGGASGATDVRAITRNLTSSAVAGHIGFEVDGRPVTVPDDGGSLLDALRDRLGLRSPKDGCSPQGQCGCCTVLVDGAPRVACVTPVRRVAGRRVTTVDGLADRRRLGRGLPGHRGPASAASAPRASSCAWPGSGRTTTGRPPSGGSSAHLCRCTGWRTILDAWDRYGEPAPDRDLEAASARATIEGGTPSGWGPTWCSARRASPPTRRRPTRWWRCPTGPGGWAVGETLAEARALAGTVQGRRTTIDLGHPVEVPPGDWDLTLQTTWVEPAYLETDASWCRPGGEPASPAGQRRGLRGQGGLPGPGRGPGPRRPSTAGRCAVLLLPGGHGPARAEAPARWAAGLRRRRDRRRAGGPDPGGRRRHRGRGAGARGRGGRRGRPADVAARCGRPGGPRRWCWRAAARGDDRPVTVTSPAGATAARRGRATTGCGSGSSAVVPSTRSSCARTARAATHMALGWVRGEGVAVDGAGTVHDLTIRSFGVLRAAETPPVDGGGGGFGRSARQRVRRRVRRSGGGRVDAAGLSAPLADRSEPHDDDPGRSLHPRRPGGGLAGRVRPGGAEGRQAGVRGHPGPAPPGHRQPPGPARGRGGVAGRRW